MIKRWFLWQVYHNPFFKPLLLLFRTRIFSRSMGWAFRTSLSKYLIKPLTSIYHISLDTYKIPEGGFANVNEFFIRWTKDEFRRFPLLPDQLGSPADSCIEVFQNINTLQDFCIKWYHANLEQLFGTGVADFMWGDVCFCRLRFSDYHRFHFFDDGEVVSSVDREWPLYSVDNDVLDTGFWVNNKSHCMKVRTKNFWDILILEVGATNVWCITNHKRVGGTFHRWEEKWYFELGWSAVLLVFKKWAVNWKHEILEKSSSKEEYEVLTGDVLNA